MMPIISTLKRIKNKLTGAATTKSTNLAAAKEPTNTTAAKYQPQTRLFLKDEQHGLILDWSAKSGCTIAVKMFFKHMGLLDTALNYHPWIHEYRDDIFYKQFGAVTPDDLKNPRYTTFKIVRNPYMRVASGYFTLVKVVAKKVPGVLKTVKTVTGISNINDLTFNHYIQFLQHIDLDICNVHFRRQYKHYEADGLCTPIVCKLESLAEGIKRVNEQCGTQLDITGLTSNHHTDTVMNQHHYVGDTPWHEIEHAIPEYFYFYNKASYNAITALYNDEITHYQYDFPWPASQLPD